MSLPAPRTSTHRHGAFRGAAAFTLIELLVVISIIALLVSILLPALSAARASAHVVQCSSNLRQVGIGINIYANDFDDQTPPNWPSYNTHTGGPTGVTRGPGLLVGPPLNRNYGQTGYLTSREIFYCPTNAVARLRDTIPANSNLWGEGVRDDYAGGVGNPVAYIGYYWIYYPGIYTTEAFKRRQNDRVTRPGNRVYLYDFGIGPYGTGSNQIPSHPNRVTNSLYIAGHVTSLPLKETQDAYTLGGLAGFVDYANEY